MLPGGEFRFRGCFRGMSTFYILAIVIITICYQLNVMDAAPPFKNPTQSNECKTREK